MSNRVLIVDDDAQLRELARTVVESMDLEALEAANGAEALERASGDAPSLILLDVMMPGSTGIEVCEQLRRQADTFEIPVVFMTAWGPELNELGVLDEDVRADGLLHKPVTAEALRTEIGRWVRTGRQEAPGADRRRHARAPVHTDVKIAARRGDDVEDPLNGPCRLSDISVAGAYVATRGELLDVGQSCELWFSFPVDPAPLRLQAEVVRVARGQRPGMGLSFRELSQEDEARIAEYVEAVRRFVR